MAAILKRICPCLNCLWDKCFGDQQPKQDFDTELGPDSDDTNTVDTEQRYVLNKKPQNEDAIYTAMWRFNARTEEELTFEEGDVFKVFTFSGEWWQAGKLDPNGKVIGKGFVPYNYLVRGESVEAQLWYFGNLSRSEAITLLLQSGNANGTFLVRISEKEKVGFVLSVRVDTNVKHFKVLQRHAGLFYLNDKHTFSTLLDVINFYKQHNLAPGVKLTNACTKQEPVLKDLSHSTVDDWERPKEEFTLQSKLGAGNFGEVFEGLWKQQVKVAIKVLRKETMNFKDFQAETQIMKKLSHKHLISLYAVCTSGDTFYIVTELMEKGSLLQYLRSKEGSTLSLPHLLDMASQVAYGMSYLESKNFIHRDLAARNVLVGENGICKVADFGLARVIKDDFYFSDEKRIPYKWSAPEAISHGRFSVKSDVWSFGILLYEIVTYGQVPYPGMSNHVFMEVEKGYRMPCPDNCPQAVYDIMMSCWEKKADARPEFKQLVWKLDNCTNYEEQNTQEWG